MKKNISIRKNISYNGQSDSKNILQKKEKLPLKDSNIQINQNNSNQKKSQNNHNEENIKKDNNSSGSIKDLFKELWANKLKRYILIGIISTIVVAVVVIAIAVSVTKKSDSNELIDPDCTGVCDKPYDIKVYSDSKLKSKLKEYKYEENSELFNFVLAAIKRHNILRACHNAKPLMFNCEIMKISQDYAETEASSQSSTNYYNGQWMGENMYWSWGKSLTGEDPANKWYKEINNYNFKTGKSDGGTILHFTQVVWKNSKELGIGYYCKDSKCTVVGNYFPGGNYKNQYLTQVQGLQE